MGDEHPSDEGRWPSDDELARAWSVIEAAELRDAERDFREQEKELAAPVPEGPTRAAAEPVSTAG